MTDDCLQAPTHMTGYSLEAWFRFLPVLRRTGIWEGIYSITFELLCSAFGLVRQFQEERRATNDSAKIKVLRGLERKWIASLRKVAAEFGFSVRWVEGVSVDLDFVGLGNVGADG